MPTATVLMYELRHELQSPVWSRAYPVSCGAGGLDDINGQVWFDFAKALNVARPALVLLENVSSIVKHKHASKIAQMMQLAHYTPVCPDVKLDDLSCTSRPRWIAILADQFAMQPRPDSYQPKLNLFGNLALALSKS